MSQANSNPIKTISLTILALLAKLACSYGQSKVEKINELVHTYVEYSHFNSSVLVAKKGKGQVYTIVAHN